MRPPVPHSEVFDDLDAEDDRLETILAELSDTQWAAPSAAAGWTVRDVIIHLAQTDEAVVHTIEERASSPLRGEMSSGSLDEAMDQAVRADTDPEAQVFDRWRRARRGASRALRMADPDRRFAWATVPLTPRVLATTRLAEHWAHALDITGPLGVPFPDTTRLRHISWLAHRTLPYAFSLAGEDAHEVFCELTGPKGELWAFGPRQAASTIRGPAGEFCRVAARRLPPTETHLAALGPHALAALQHLRTYAA